MDQLTPDQIAGRDFRNSFRGSDPTEVKEFLAVVAAQVADLVAQRDRLAGRLGEFAERDLKNEFAAVGEEVTGVLEAARDAAEGMRDRATTDAARWRSEALTEAEADRRSAREDAEQLRSDAWLTSEELLRQAQNEARRLSEGAERDSLSVLGEAEREAHRLVATARRESDDLTRVARMESERLNAEANARHDEIVETARRQAEASQERARALEQRRQELLTELETLRSSLSRMEGELDERRNRLGLSGSEDEATEPLPRATREKVDSDWGPGETVRVVSKRKEPVKSDADFEDVVEDVRRRQSQPARPEKRGQGAEEMSEEPLVGPAVTPEPEVEPELVVATEEVVEVRGDDLGDIFSRLRGAPTPTPIALPPPIEQPPTIEVPLPSLEKVKAEPRTDPFELQRRLVLPVTNRALRNLKRQLTELQNQALEEVRTSEGAWRPTTEDTTPYLRPELVVLLAEGFSMGHTAAEELTGRTFPRPPTPARDEATAMAQALVGQVSEVLESPDPGGREQSTAMSRVFRAWRTDEAERRVNDLASSAYHSGLAATLDGGGEQMVLLVGGRGCARCREAAEAPDIPELPLHPGCSCTLIPT